MKHLSGFPPLFTPPTLCSFSYCVDNGNPTFTPSPQITSIRGLTFVGMCWQFLLILISFVHPKRPFIVIVKTVKKQSSPISSPHGCLSSAQGCSILKRWFEREREFYFLNMELWPRRVVIQYIYVCGQLWKWPTYGKHEDHSFPSWFASKSIN